MPKIYQVDVRYYICADNSEQAETAVVMASSQIYESMRSHDVSHTAKVAEHNIFHAHQLPMPRTTDDK